MRIIVVISKEEQGKLSLFQCSLYPKRFFLTVEIICLANANLVREKVERYSDVEVWG